MCVNECVCVSVVFHWQATIMGPVGCVSYCHWWYFSSVTLM